MRRRVVVHGRVQGVGFRASTREHARRLTVDGWVRNRPDGSVEVVAEGAPPNVGALLAYLERGPSWARVDRLETSEEAAEDLRGFEIR